VRHLLGISRSTEALGRLLVDLFELAKLEAEELVPVPAPCSVPAILDDLALMYGAAADQIGVSIHVEGPEELPPAIADAALIERAVANLLDNAMRHTPRGGRVVLAASRSEDGSVRIEVSDTGPGIPEASLPLVFDRFYQVDRAGSSPKGLCGLGLAIVRRIVESHGSAIELRSAPGEGTTFAFTLRADSDERWAHT
jgi:signal transduction histidine kinase